MKKKIIMILTVFVFIFSGCGTETAESQENIIAEENIANNPAPPKDEIQPSATFSMSSADISAIVYGINVESFSKSTDKYTIDVFPYNDYLLFCVTSNNDLFPSCIYAYDQAKGGTPESAINLLQPFLDTLSKDQNIQSGTYGLGGSLRRVLYCVWVDGFDYKEFPFTIQILPDVDYFLFADINEYKSACSEGRYNDIFFDVQSYIDEYNPPTYDNAYTLQSVLSPIIDNWENIEVKYDSVENYATFYYSNVEKINNDIHFVPYALTNERNIRSLIGFYNSNWLFFNSIIISSDENISISTSNNKIEDIIDGDKIYEAYIYTIEDDDLNQLISFPNHTIRFKGENGDFKDYEMTSEEYEALISISKFQNVRNILSDLLFHFQNRMSD